MGAKQSSQPSRSIWLLRRKTGLPGGESARLRRPLHHIVSLGRCFLGIRFGLRCSHPSAASPRRVIGCSPPSTAAAAAVMARGGGAGRAPPPTANAFFRAYSEGCGYRRQPIWMWLDTIIVEPACRSVVAAPRRGRAPSDPPPERCRGDAPCRFLLCGGAQPPLSPAAQNSPSQTTRPFRVGWGTVRH